jgi:hypothetical protein
VCERRDSVSFYDYKIHEDCYNRALYIRLYCSILLFREPYKEFDVGPFLRFFIHIPYTYTTKNIIFINAHLLTF